jgi:hypothetical protein
MKKILIPLFLLLAIPALNVFVNKLTPQEPPAAFPRFQTSDINGHTVTNEIFNGRFTVLVMWVTKDEHSRQLLQALSSWQETKSANLQIVCLVGDVKTTDTTKIPVARQMTAGLTLPQLLVNDDMAALLTTFRAAPTICFVNPYGQLVGQPVTGHELELIKKEACRLMAADSPANIDKSPIMKKLSH